MKVTVNVECSPEEARAFLGLPDVAPMQQALMKELEDRLRSNIQAMTPDAMLKTWLPTSMQNVEQAQKVFWGQIQQTMNGLASTTTKSISDEFHETLSQFTRGNSWKRIFAVGTVFRKQFASLSKLASLSWRLCQSDSGSKA